MKYLISFLLIPFCLFASTNVSIIGDSISEGFGVQPGECYVDLLRQRYIQEGKDIQIINRSYKGAQTDTGEMATVQLLTMDKPDYFVTFIGINDAGFNVPQSQLIANFDAMIKRAHYNCKGVILGGVNSQTVNPSYNSVLLNTYVYLINTYQVYPVMLLGTEVLATTIDGIHPDPIGHQMIANYLYDALHAVGAY